MGAVLGTVIAALLALLVVAGLLVVAVALVGAGWRLWRWLTPTTVPAPRRRR